MDATLYSCAECEYEWHVVDGTVPVIPACPRCGAEHPKLAALVKDAEDAAAKLRTETAPAEAAVPVSGESLDHVSNLSD